MIFSSGKLRTGTAVGPIGMALTLSQRSASLLSPEPARRYEHACRGEPAVFDRRPCCGRTLLWC